MCGETDRQKQKVRKTFQISYAARVQKKNERSEVVAAVDADVVVVVADDDDVVVVVDDVLENAGSPI